MTLETRTSTKLDMPVTVADLAAFLGAVPEEAELLVTVWEGGSQRDPYPIAYTFTARWES